MDMDTEQDPTSNKSFYTGVDKLNYTRDHMEIQSPIQNGLISDWEGVEKLLDHTFKFGLRINPNEHPILLTEPSFNTANLREKATEILFEKYDTPALFLAKSGVLSTFANGRTSALVVECGGGFTSATPVYDGHVLTKGVVSSNLGGIDLTNIFLNLLETEGHNIRPMYSIHKKQRVDGEFDVTDKYLPNVSRSYHRYQSYRVVEDIKETLCRVSDIPLEKDDPYPNLALETYPMPDSSIMSLGINRFKVSECLFEPKFIPANLGINTTNMQGIQHMIFNSVSSCDVDIRKELFMNIVFSGGTTLINGFQERLQRELSTKAPQQIKMKYVIPPLGLDKKYSVFLGGSILGSLGTSYQMWMSKTEYEEYGKSLVERKCP